MGNGESTAKRISMQKTTEGTVQISEEVLSRLRKGKGREIYEEPPEDEIKIKQDNLRQILNDAYQKGKSDGERMAIKEMEVRKSESGSAEDKNSSKLNDIEESMQQRNAEINELNKKINELELLAETKLKEKQEMIEVANQQLTAEQKEKDGLYAKILEVSSKYEEQTKQLEESTQNLEKEKHEKEEYLKMLNDRDESMKVEFNKGVEDMQQRLRPLQKDVLCKELRQDAIACYMKNKDYPLRCSNIVSQFRECVQNARRRNMEKDEAP